MEVQKGMKRESVGSPENKNGGLNALGKVALKA